MSQAVFYTNSESYLLQPRNNHGEPIMITENFKKFSNKATSFPLISNEYVLRRLEKTQPHEIPKLYLTPPLHAHKIKHSIMNDTNIEFIHPFDDALIIRIYQDSKNGVVYVQMFNFNKQKPIDGFKWDLKETKLIDGNPINMKSFDPKLKNTNMKYEISISCSGEYI